MGKNNTFSDAATDRYSLALYELAEENKSVREIEDQSSALIQLIEKSNDFASVIKDPTSKKEDQINAIIKISEYCNFNSLLKNFLCFLAEKRRLFFVKNILKNFVNICSKKRGEISASLVAAKELTNNEIEKIKNELSNNFGKKVKLNYKYNSDLIGGLIIQIGSVMIDTSIKNKLKKLENKMIEA